SPRRLQGHRVFEVRRLTNAKVRRRTARASTDSARRPSSSPRPRRRAMASSLSTSRAQGKQESSAGTHTRLNLQATVQPRLHLRRRALSRRILLRVGRNGLLSSPVLKARPASLHGYDIVDHSQVNPETGGEERFAEL